MEKHYVAAARKDGVEIAHTVNTRRTRLIPCATLLPLTMRQPNDALYHELVQDRERLSSAGISSVTRIGDCFGPSTIAAAVYSGHRYAREIDSPETDDVPFKRELVELSAPLRAT